MMPMPCQVCEINTSQHDGGIDEYFMVQHQLWAEAVKGLPRVVDPVSLEDKQFLCIGCIEDRLRRVLTCHDFLNVPCNCWPSKSARLTNRRGY